MPDCVLCDLSDEQVHDHLKARKGGPVCDACYEEARALLQEMAKMHEGTD